MTGPINMKPLSRQHRRRQDRKRFSPDSFSTFIDRCDAAAAARTLLAAINDALAQQSHIERHGLDPLSTTGLVDERGALLGERIEGADAGGRLACVTRRSPGGPPTWF